ncbi:unnamed protein product [Bursaphelenchus okinawaensis]|uniref:Uncharacterized protein n=1 Tax=Bursaphelenchus okinawaensis TaxID=465554 RepID=A0A811LJP2_9BILA|nr:unnamed protein product [Bursaphelenchus okinawaensis]CAG9123703.1 unnamed protein product [Bursaphelenchus okinawaensis]
MSSYCGLQGSYVAAGNGRMMPKSTYVQPQASTRSFEDVEDDEITDTIEQPIKVNVGGDVAHEKTKKPKTASKPSKVFAKPAQPVLKPVQPVFKPAQCNNGFVYSLYADQGLGDRNAFEQPPSDAEDEGTVTPVNDEDNWERQRLEEEADQALKNYEDIKKRLIELELKGRSSTKKVGFRSEREVESQSSVKVEPVQYHVEQKPSVRQDYGDAESMYIGIPNTMYAAKKQPSKDYHYEPATAASAPSVEPLTSTELESNHDAFSHYHLPSLRDVYYCE